MSDRKTFVIVAMAALVFWLSCLVLDTLGSAGAFRSIEPHFNGSCRRVAGVVGAEDIVVDPETRIAFMSNEDWRATKAGRPVPGSIRAYRLDRLGPPEEVPSDFDEPLHPHGLSLLRTDDGEARLFVVHHPTPDESTVEIFAIEPGPRLRHLRTVEGPEIVSANDVAAVGPEQFYVTNDAGTRPSDALRAAETFLRLPWASVVYFDGIRLTKVAEGLRYANGIALSENGHRVYVTETTGQELRVYARDRQNGALTEMSHLRIPSGPDNLTLAPDGALWIGAHPQMLKFLEHAGDPQALSPSQVLRAVVGDDGEITVEEILLSHGADLSGSSVAVPLGNRLLVGSVFERHILDCRLLPSNAR